MAGVSVVNLAVVGPTGVGKTSLIQSLLFQQRDVGFLEPTREWLPHVYNGNITFWDSPGYGEFVDVFENLSGGFYDGIILVVRDRMQPGEMDLLATILRPNSKRLVVARIMSQAETHEDSDAVIAAMYEEFQHLRKDLFLVDLANQGLYGFDDLVRHLNNPAKYRYITAEQLKKFQAWTQILF